MTELFSFAPSGPVTLVGASAVQVGSQSSNCYRVANLSSSYQYFTHGQSSGVSSVGAPSAGVPSQSTIGMLPLSVEIFNYLGPWMIASSATGFEVTPGSGT
jgi:hypothetical protein